MTYRQNNRDDNEDMLIELAQAAGCFVKKMDRHAGFDNIIFCPRTGTHIVEVKNPAYKWELTPAEKKMKAAIEMVGGVYNIIENDEQLKLLIGLYN